MSRSRLQASKQQQAALQAQQAAQIGARKLKDSGLIEVLQFTKYFHLVPSKVCSLPTLPNVTMLQIFGALIMSKCAPMARAVTMLYSVVGQLRICISCIFGLDCACSTFVVLMHDYHAGPCTNLLAACHAILQRLFLQSASVHAERGLSMLLAELIYDALCRASGSHRSNCGRREDLKSGCALPLTQIQPPQDLPACKPLPTPSRPSHVSWWPLRSSIWPSSGSLHM